MGLKLADSGATSPMTPITSPSEIMAKGFFAAIQPLQLMASLKRDPKSVLSILKSQGAKAAAAVLAEHPYDNDAIRNGKLCLADLSDRLAFIPGWESGLSVSNGDCSLDILMNFITDVYPVGSKLTRESSLLSVLGSCLKLNPAYDDNALTWIETWLKNHEDNIYVDDSGMLKTRIPIENVKVADD